MKLKTLLMVVAMLCVSLFVVACGGGDDTTATPGTQAPGATTTKAQTTTTKKTTKTTTKKTTTTTVTTTLSPDFFTKIPAKLPNNESYEVGVRIGLEAAEDYLALDGVKYVNLGFSNTGIYGNAFKMGCSMTAGSGGTPNRAEVEVQLFDPFSPEGLKGILWYVDFSEVDPHSDASKLPCTSITVNRNEFRSNKDGDRATRGYYLKDGEWVQTVNVNACRMEVPVGFKGWLYVPFTSYTGEGVLYDSVTGLGIEGKFVTAVRLYTDNYTYSDQKGIVFDEVIFVK